MKKLSKYIGCEHVVSVSNASNALFLACKVLGIKKGSSVWCSTITFISSISGAYQLGAKVEFLEIDNLTFNIDLNKLEQKLKVTKKIPDLIIVTHLGGNPIDLLKLEKLQKKYNFKIIEDASHALGSSFNKKKIGNSKISEFVVFSFHPVKSITTGEGGALATNDKKLYNHAKSLRSHGLNRIKKNKILKSDLDYDIVDLGYNFRLSDINAALGLSQLKKLDMFIQKRNLIANYYKNFFKYEKKITSQKISYNSKSSYHLYIIKINNINLKIKNKLNHVMKKNNIEINFHYVPIYKFSFLKNKKLKNFLNSEKYYREAISLPIHNNLNKNDVKKYHQL